MRKLNIKYFCDKVKNIVKKNDINSIYYINRNKAKLFE